MQKLQENEIIKDIKDYEGLYAITSFGRVWAYPKKSICYGRNTKGMWLKGRYTDGRNGYKKVVLYKDKEKKNISIHRLVALSFLNNENKYLQINHIDGNRLNNNFSNLEWCNTSQNCQHRELNGLGTKGKISNRNKSGIVGVISYKGKWASAISINSKSYWLGTYETKEKASEIYQFVLKQSFSKKWSLEELKEIIDTYRLKLKEM